MEKIIVDPQDFNAVEVSLNGRFAPYMGMNQLSYRELVKKEASVLQELDKIALKSELPKAISSAKKELMMETLKVVQKVIELMKAGFHVALILDMLKITVGKKSDFGDDFHRRFEPLFREENCRIDFWGTKEPFCFLTVMGLLNSLMI